MITKKKAKHQNEENNLPPMHRAIETGKYGRWCFFSVLGGLDGALNGQVQSTIKILRSKRDGEDKWESSNSTIHTSSTRHNWQSSNAFVKFGLTKHCKSMGNNLCTKLLNWEAQS